MGKKRPLKIETSAQKHCLQEVKKIKRNELEVKVSPKNCHVKSEICLPEQISTKCQLQTNKRQVEVVVFKSKKPQTNTKTETKFALESNHDHEQLSTKKLLSKLQWDVNSLGLKGFTLEERRKLEQERAIKLGAKPKKPEYINYKILMEKRKDAQNNQAISIKKGRKPKKSVFWRESKDDRKFGKFGKYKDGLLKLHGSVK